MLGRNVQQLLPKEQLQEFPEVLPVLPHLLLQSAGYMRATLRASIVEGAEWAESLCGRRERSMQALRYAPIAADEDSLALLLLAEI